MEVIDDKGSPLHGYSAADCIPMESDAVRHVVRWRNAKGLASLAGKTVRLRFHLRNASLYSFSVGAL